ncbi:MAG TPA: M48 family metalloprotease [Pirellulales bacterium]|nr:M48 family metalloprotease [Pirellulales bacterium]
MPSSLAAAAEQPRPNVAALTPALRQKIDELAGRSPAPNLHEQSVDFSGNVVAWLISQAALSPAEELRAAEQSNQELLRRFRTAATPPAAQQAFDKLLGALPPHLKPAEFRYRLTVLESDDLDALTVGGGYVYVTRATVEALLADDGRGPSALGLVLAGELGHIGLGHCRRGYQSLKLEDDVKAGLASAVDEKLLRRAWETGFERTGGLLRFLYARDEVYEADLFALHLCRNAGFDEDASLDALRWLIWLREGDSLDRPRAAAREGESTSAAIDALTVVPTLSQRLKRLLMERNGRTNDESAFGLFVVDAATGKLTKAPANAAQPGQPAIAFVHGFAGKEATFESFFRELAKRPEAAAYKILFFRYPNNGSLSAAGELLAHEMARSVSTPERTLFVAHSAGGLVFRYYAEKKRGGFDRAVLLGTPNGGVGLTQLKFIVDAGTFFRDLKFGLPEAVQRAVHEGSRQLTHDLHADSLFLRYLGYDAALAQRYEIYCGRKFNAVEALGLTAAVEVARRLLAQEVVERIEQPRWKQQLGRLVDHLRLPEEVADGDLIVSVDSATLPGAAAVTVTRLNHLELNSDPDLIATVLDSVFRTQGADRK